MHFHPNTLPPHTHQHHPRPVLFLLIGVPPSIPTSVLLFLSSLLTCFPLFLLCFLPCHLHPPPRPPSILSIFLGCGCDVSAVTLISSGDVSILSVLLHHHPHPPPPIPSLSSPCYITNSSFHLFFSFSRTFTYQHCFSPLLLPVSPRPVLYVCVCVCVLLLHCNRKQLCS